MTSLRYSIPLKYLAVSMCGKNGLELGNSFGDEAEVLWWLVANFVLGKNSTESMG